MIDKNQIVAFIISFLITGFILLSLQELSLPVYAGGFACCQFPIGAECVPGEPECTSGGGTVCVEEPDLSCLTLGQQCTCPPPQIPTLSQWGKIITIAVIGVFAVIGLIIMRRTGVVRSYQD